MGIKNFFVGRTGRIFWINIALMGFVLVAVPMGALFALDVFTRHGEKVEVPSVTGLTDEQAIRRLERAGFNVEIADSTYRQGERRGVVLDQTPKAGTEIKTERTVYLTINLKGEPMLRFPNIEHSRRIMEQTLLNMGFKLSPIELKEGEPKDWVVGVRQGMYQVHPGDMIARSKALTLIVGAGVSDSTDVDTSYVEHEDISIDFDM